MVVPQRKIASPATDPRGAHEWFTGFLIVSYTECFPFCLALDQVRVITLNNDQALINYAKPSVNKLRANMVHVDSDLRVTPFKAKISDAEH